MDGEGRECGGHDSLAEREVLGVLVWSRGRSFASLSSSYSVTYRNDGI